MKRRILVIEDNEQNLYLMRYLLGRHGFEVLEAHDGHQGIVAARADRPDMILLDIQLPRMSGHDVARELQRDASLASVPIVAVTSYAMPGDREQAIAAGCAAYIEKPIHPETFVAQLEAVFVQHARPERGEGACNEDPRSG